MKQGMFIGNLYVRNVKIIRRTQLTLLLSLAKIRTIQVGAAAGGTLDGHVI